MPDDSKLPVPANQGIDVASVAAALPGLARVAAGSVFRVASWGIQTSNATTGRALRALASGESPTKVVAEAGTALRAAARELLGINGPSGPIDTTGTPQPGPATIKTKGTSPASAAELRARGAQLLSQSADVWHVADTHPAYERILDEISPDEARILRFLQLEGPQPSIDIRTNRPLGVGSELVASGLSMIGLQAGVRHLDRTKADLNNLERLGLIWFSKEQVSDPTRYQVVEVQPDVLEHMKRAGRSPKTIHRSVHLTPFGEDFCEVCLVVEG